MAETNGSPGLWTRETRLLLLVVVVSVTVLLVVARFRFPSATLNAPAPAAGPLATLAGRTAFDDLSSSMASLVGRATPATPVIRLDPVSVPAISPSVRRGRTAHPVSEAGPTQIAPGLRLQGDLVVVYVPPGLKPAAADGAVIADVVFVDTERQIAVVRIPLAHAINDITAALMPSFTYVGEVRALSSGVTVRPVFLGRVDPIADARWPGDVFALDSLSGLALGSVLFTIDGHHLGLVVPAASADAVVVPETTLAAVIDQKLRAAGARP
jgi:hypothetical protein